MVCQDPQRGKAALPKSMSGRGSTEDSTSETNMTGGKC
jgi:hypothetical protein